MASQGDTPAWATADDTPSFSEETNDINAGATMLRSSGAGEPTALDITDDKELPSIVLFMRLANMGAAGLLIAASIVKMISLPSPSNWILSVYATCGGLLVCCLETQLKFLRVAIALNFGYLFSPTLRFVFYLVMGSVAWQFNDILGKISAITLVATAIFNTYVLCRYPSYRAVREKIAEEEDRRIEAKISDGIKKQAVNSMLGPGSV
eukprot:CAMPEP_0172517630 /NCGR_PEP_ID=MMETSP1066-20121228/286658_1 /TAXON_ID=671091 /ORGANISM="Coscinodiscus wailesii, Strain CCMP2513" /LENGTH=207 /DNA_ID=CAMNT_0013299733 /DNA_START=101 /DNA_END=724 /DNA_ORIENTATION=+